MIEKKGLSVYLYTPSWKDTLKIEIYNPHDDINYIIDVDKNKLFILDNWYFLYKVNFKSGKVVSKVRRFGQGDNSYGKNKLIHTTSNLIWYNGITSIVYDDNLNELAILSDSLDQYIEEKKYVKLNPCSYTITKIIDSVFVSNKHINILFKYCDEYSDRIIIENSFNKN